MKSTRDGSKEDEAGVPLSQVMLVGNISTGNAIHKHSRRDGGEKATNQRDPPLPKVEMPRTPPAESPVPRVERLCDIKLQQHHDYAPAMVPPGLQALR